MIILQKLSNNKFYLLLGEFSNPPRWRLPIRLVARTAARPLLIDTASAGVPPLRDSDLNEARALLTYATAQLAATILELRSRYGIQYYYMEGPVWPQEAPRRPSAAAEDVWGPPVGPPVMEFTPVKISYEYMQQLTCEAVGVARGRHVDSSLQALFVLGDMALVTYNLPEAQRILSIVALAAADGQVRPCAACCAARHPELPRLHSMLLRCSADRLALAAAQMATSAS